MPAGAPTTPASTHMAPAPEPRPPVPATDGAAPAARRGFLATGWDKLRDNALPGLAMTIVAGLVLFTLEGTGDRITRLEDRVTRLDDRVTRFEDRVDARFTKLEDDIDARFTKLEDRVTRLDERVDARFTKLEDDIDARFTKLEENQHDIAQTLAVLVALVKANNQGEAITRAETVPAGHHGATA